MKKLLLSIISIIMIICFSATAFAASGKEPKKGTVSLNQKSIILYAYEEGADIAKGFNQSYKLKASTSKGYIVKDYIWSSSNTEIAEVSSDGTVMAKAPGTATITVKSYNGKASASCKVTVYMYYNLSHEGFCSQGCLHTGDTQNWNKIMQDSHLGNNFKLTFSSSNTKVATISSKGILKAKAPGKATITIKDKTSNTSLSFRVEVRKPATIELNKTKITLNVKKTSKLTLDISGDVEATYNMLAHKTLQWVSSNPKVATVDSNGVITAKAPGTAKITAISFGDKTMGTCTVTVKK